jgi:hypothetical protein
MRIWHLMTAVLLAGLSSVFVLHLYRLNWHDEYQVLWGCSLIYVGGYVVIAVGLMALDWVGYLGRVDAGSFSYFVGLWPLAVPFVVACFLICLCVRAFLAFAAMPVFLSPAAAKPKSADPDF